MSTDTLERFVERVSSDEVAAARLKAALEGKEGDEAVQSLVAFARESGFEVDAQDVAQIGRARDGELTDDQLDAVAGGNFLVDWWNDIKPRFS